MTGWSLNINRIVYDSLIYQRLKSLVDKLLYLDCININSKSLIDDIDIEELSFIKVS